MGERKTKKQVIQHLLLILREQPLSINELAVKADINWETTKGYLEFLKEFGIIGEFEDGNKRMFKLIRPVEINKDTLFNLPLNPQDEERCKTIFGFVKTRWYEKTKKYPGRTQMQKTVIEIADRMGLDIPRGWYLLGEMCVLQYNDMETYDIKPEYITRELTLTVDLCIDELSSLTTDAIIQRQYERKNKKLYLIKKKLNEMLLTEIETQEQKQQIGALLYSLAINFPEKSDNKEIIELLTIFVGCVNQLFVLKPVEDIEILRPEMQEIYMLLWELMASYNLYCSLTEEYKKYPKETAFPYFKPRFDTLIQLARELLAHFAEPCKLTIEEEKYKELYELKGSVKPIEYSEQEKKSWLDDFEKKS
jgi:predicted transcriptional regulator